MIRLLDLKRHLDETGVFMYFNGQISQNLLLQLGDTLKQKLQTQEVKSQTILKVFSMFVEQAQNVIRYSATGTNDVPDVEDSQVGVVTVGYDGNYYFVASGNEVMTADVNRLKEKLQKIVSMDKDQLKAYYKEVRKNDTPDDSTGAGLGFIEMARKSDKPLEFEFSELDNRKSFFTLITLISGE